MPLVLNTTVGDPAANGYASVADADQTAAYRLSGPAVGWADLESAQKIQALVTATADLDTNDFASEPLTAEQALQFPRVAWPSIPPAIRQATIELAFVYAAQAVADSTVDVLNAATNGNIKREKVGPLETEYFAPTSDVSAGLARYPAIVQRLLTRYLRVDAAEAAGAWGSGIAVRTS